MMSSVPQASLVRRLAVSAVVPAALTIIYATQAVLTAKQAWSHALGQEAVFCGTWWLVGVLVFQLCAWLHRQPPSRRRVVAGLCGGAIGVMLLEPSLLMGCRIAVEWASGAIWGRPFDAAATGQSWSQLFLSLFGFNVIIYGGVVAAWYALTYYRDLQRRRLESAELQSLLQRAQLQALRSQLNPHFLFNTLHSIAELVHEDPRLAEQMLLRLSELLRKALHSSGAQEVPLADEIEFAKGYLEIEQLRLGDRLRLTWDIEPEACQARVPSLLLQPLVENAIRHGIAPSTRQGTLVIRARRDHDFLEVQVHDNGSGLAAEGSDRGGGVGLANTSERLQRLYGDRQRFELINDQGLRVNVRLPFSLMPTAAHAT
jgi:two-component system LytT family sensor kinase